MKKSRAIEHKTCHYFVDEAGDGNLFSSSGQVIIGREGCTRFFILGLVEIENPPELVSQLEILRAQLLADPYFKNVPSMQSAARKTAFAFHAKDDLPEVRREVFALLSKHPVRFFAVVRDKSALLKFVQTHNRFDSSYRYNPNELYDNLVARLFHGKLHKAEKYKICFAQRGKTPRTDALRAALEKAQLNFQHRWGLVSESAIEITASAPPQTISLQIADYYLWALQRLYERREDRYVDLLWKSFRLVLDLDDTRILPYGVYYTQKKPLKIAALQELPEI